MNLKPQIRGLNCRFETIGWLFSVIPNHYTIIIGFLQVLTSI